MTNNKITPDAILTALSQVDDPELGKDLVALKMIHDIKIEGGDVNFTLILTTPACPLKDKIKKDATAAVKAIPGVETVNVTLDAQVPNDGQERGLLDMPIRNAIAIASGKGGVGKSTVSVNIAVTLAQNGAKVGLLDADIYGPNIPTMMGVDRLPPPKNDKLVPAEAYGVRLMSMGFLTKPNQPLIWRGPILHSAIRQFLTDVHWGELDYLIIDLPPGTGDVQLSLAQSLPLSGGVIVTLPQQLSVEDARRGLEMFRELNVPILGIIENMSYIELPDGTKMEVFGTGGGERLAKDTQTPFIGTLPLDKSVSEGGDSGKPIVISAPNSAAAKAMRSAAEGLAAKVSVAAMKKSEHNLH